MYFLLEELQVLPLDTEIEDRGMEESPFDVSLKLHDPAGPGKEGGVLSDCLLWLSLINSGLPPTVALCSTAVHTHDPHSSVYSSPHCTTLYLKLCSQNIHGETPQQALNFTLVHCWGGVVENYTDCRCPRKSSLSYPDSWEIGFIYLFITKEKKDQGWWNRNVFLL